jgi:hypothetical protein
MKELDYEIKPWFQCKGGKGGSGSGSGNGSSKGGAARAKKDAAAAAASLHHSFVDAHTMDIIRDAKTWMCFIPNKYLPGDERQDFVGLMNMPQYELPDGTKV